jgi:dipeptidyl aminopeptidase/acylaminoacyl peptidase
VLHDASVADDSAGPCGRPRNGHGGAAQPRAGALSIEQLIDIKHPSNPVWSRDSRRIAFTWERAGVANLYVVPADGSARPAQVTTDGVPGNVFWSPDSSSLPFFRGGGALFSLPLDGTGAKPRFGDFAPRSPSVSRNGTKIVYLAAGNTIRVRSLVDGSDSLVATLAEPVATVS